MKKIILSMALAAAAMSINAQLVVDSLGRVGIGTERPRSMLSVGARGMKNASIYCENDHKIWGMNIINHTDTTRTTYGIDIEMENLTGTSYGVRSIATGDIDLDEPRPSQYLIGLCGIAGKAYNTIGVYGGKYTTSTPFVNYAGIYGDEFDMEPTFMYGGINYSGIYAGFFRGKVRVTHGIYATLLSPTASPSPSEQSGTTILSDRNERVTDKLSQVQTLQFLRYEPNNEEVQEVEEEQERNLSPIQYGLDVNQLKAVYPELVYEDANGNVSINYVEMVPLLVQSIKELKAELAELVGTRRGASASGKQIAETTAIEDNVSDIDMVRMDQNKPNPFSESTVITLNIPDKAQAASIFIYDMSGKQVQCIPVTERGETNITVYASNLTAGMYIYTLVVDGKVEMNRRMIVEK